MQKFGCLSIFEFSKTVVYGLTNLFCISMFSFGHGTSFVTAVPLDVNKLIPGCVDNLEQAYSFGNSNRSGRELGFINGEGVGAILQSE